MGHLFKTTKNRVSSSIDKRIKNSALPLALAGLMAASMSSVMATEIQITDDPVGIFFILVAISS